MKKNFSPVISASLLTGMVLLLSTPFAAAHDDLGVGWSVRIGTPAPVYRPPVVYVQPRPVYVESMPVYVERRGPVVRYSRYYPQPYYVEAVRHGHRSGRHWQHHRHHD